MIDELEEEVAEMRAIVVRSGASEVKKLEEESKKLSAELSDLKAKNDELLRETSEFIDLAHHSSFPKFPFHCRKQEQHKLVTAERCRAEAAEEFGRK